MAGAADAAKEYAAGCAAGIAQVVVGHPFDTVKVKMQAHNTTAQGKVYKNAFHCTSRILLDEGIRGLYKGASSSFIGIAVESSLFFGSYSQAKQLLQGNSEDGRPQLQVIIPSAACSGALISCILTPTELTKCRMQVQGKNTVLATRYSSPLDCAMKTLEAEGLRGIFRGGLATLFRETIDIGIGIMSGGISGWAFWTATLPLDVAKTVIQTASDRHLSRNPFQILRMIYRRAGMGGCYAGLGPTLARAFPANAAAIVTWEYSAKILGINRGSY
ncbi:hypothetical protein QOZ80_1AG0017800 [Eleusine coracana subsp. coracana]|nr:hypothetical protein QOZ80_1AG0017800 [Eleusine coracana subsp. coracana]